MVVKITQPKDHEDISVGEPVKFIGTADSNIVRIELLADGRWSLGKSSITARKWSVTYSFTRSGTRNVVIQGFDSSGEVVASDSIWLSVNPAVIDLDMQLSPNFTLRELTQSTTADRKGIDNTPNEQEIENLKTLCRKILQPARDALGPLKISSGFRSEELNREVGGVSDSDHRLGFAADVYPISAGTKELAEWIVRHISDFDQVIMEFGTRENPNWIHISVAPRNRRQFLRAFLSGGKVVYEDA